LLCLSKHVVLNFSKFTENCPRPIEFGKVKSFK
jgi:hypothetical protein